MAVLKLEVEVDSVAHPELYALVSAITLVPFREERVRQLAATGMIWERLRLSAGTEPVGAGKADSAAGSARLALVSTAKPSSLEALRLPVLRDEVPLGAPPEAPASVLPQDAEVPAQVPAAAEPPQRDHPPAAPEPPLDNLPATHMPGTRSRLMRMKSRGLFTNE